ncbi:hypothetical protein [Bradyrhizobium sp. URHD0069]|uniref:hypothetical protein n=1 Tax=Bradyrhizobium sp. URHD0069 TaxID=1380355 RepID=UPI000495C1AA|nr:hypothetical protein [Bradyrhizobium sp. URHD0069]
MDSVRIKSEGGIANGTKVIDTVTGAEIQGIERIAIDLRAGDLVRAKIDLCAVQLDVAAHAEYRVASPKTGDMKAVRRIEFADGEVVEF